MDIVQVTQSEWKTLIEKKEYNYHLLWECGEILTIEGLMYPVRYAVVDEHPVCVFQGIVTDSETKKIEFGGYLGEGMLFLEGDQYIIMKTFLDFLEVDVTSCDIFFFLDEEQEGYSCISNTFHEYHYNSTTAYTPLIDLQHPASEVWNRMKDSTKRAVQQAVKRGTRVVENTTPEGVEWFCELMERYDLGMSSDPHVLTTMLQTGIKLQVVNLFFAVVGSDVAAGAAILKCRDVIGYTLGGMKREYTQYRPSNLLHWEIMKWAKKSGYTQYNMVWAPPQGHPGYSIAQFKLGFGAHVKKVPVYFKRIKRC